MSLAQVSDEQLVEAIKKANALIPRLSLPDLHKLEVNINNIMRHNTSDVRSFAITSLVLNWRVAVRNAMRYDYVEEVG